MKRYRNLLIAFIIFIYIINISFVNAENMEIDVSTSQPGYFPGETIDVFISITSVEEFSGVLIVEMLPRGYSEYFDPEPFTESINMIGRETKDFTFSHFVSEIDPSGDYDVLVNILDVNEQIVSETSTSFQIIGTLEIFSFSIDNNKKIYKKGESVDIAYTSDILGINIDATLIAPDKSIQEIILPYSFIPDQIGTYIVKAVASKEGYREISIEEQFAVLEEHANIQTVNLEELAKKRKEIAIKDRYQTIIFYLIIGIFIFIIGLIIFLIYRHYKKDENEIIMQQN